MRARCDSRKRRERRDHLVRVRVFTAMHRVQSAIHSRRNRAASFTDTALNPT
jgi:hypothetical protein